MKKLSRFGLAMAMFMSLAVLGGGTAFAASSVNSPNKVDLDTVRLNWTGQGTTAGQLNDEKCGANADPGAGGFQNGATADDYLLWIFTHDGGSVTGSPTLTVDGTTYTTVDDQGSFQIVTPGFDPATINDAHANFVVNTTGNGDWVLTISHGCVGTVEDLPFAPAGHVGGPCADPAYYAVFDNSGTDASFAPVKFRMRWYNNNGLNAVTKFVPGGMIYTTFQHWAKPGTYVAVSYKDPNTGMWVLLDKELVVKGRYPACDVKPGWSQLS